MQATTRATFVWVLYPALTTVFDDMRDDTTLMKLLNTAGNFPISLQWEFPTSKGKGEFNGDS